MGAYDGAECCEIIGLYMLAQLKKEYPNLNIGLYRDDGLGAHRRIPGPELERVKKRIIALFKRNGLAITIQTGLKEVDFLDVTLNLTTEKFKPYCKPNNTPTYISTSSNHPPNVLKRIPETIGSRLSNLSSNEEDFNNAKNEYEDALKRSGYKEQANLKYKPKNDTTKKKPRSRKITWFNPPYAANLETNLGKKFLNLIEQHFPKENPLSKVLNRHTIKLSYSCMPNMRAKILQHNNKILKDSVPPAPAGCNCRKQECPLQKNCKVQCLVYEAKVCHNGKSVVYYGSTANDFKTRYRNHKSSFNKESKSNDTALASYVWEHGLSCDPPIKWRVVGTRPPVTPGGTCGVCLLEKTVIMKNSGPNTLNKRSEIYKKCPHRDKHSLRHC